VGRAEKTRQGCFDEEMNAGNRSNRAGTGKGIMDGMHDSHVICKIPKSLSRCVCSAFEILQRRFRLIGGIERCLVTAR
jgi:hypothetical protein